MSNLDSKYIINLDLMQDTKNNTMHFNLSDSETSDFWINITRYTVDINEELLDKTVTLYVVKPNKNVEFGNISYDSTEKMYYCNLSSEFKNIKGNYTAQVVIYDSSTKERKVTRSKFKYYVEDDILSDASGTVKPEEQENILDDIISRLAALEEGGGGTSATASNITITDTANNFTATNVEDALAEVGSQIKDIANNGAGSSQIGNLDDITETENNSSIVLILKDLYARIEKANSTIAKLVRGEDILEPFYEGDIPIVTFTGDITNMSKDNPVMLQFSYESQSKILNCYAEVKWQGTSSLSYAKKNYTIKLYDDANKTNKNKFNMKGWGQQNKFCLKANWIDSTHSRNIVGARLGASIIGENSTLPSNTPNGGLIDGVPIKVIINGNSVGLYTWNIPKDGWMFGMTQEDGTQAVLCSESVSDAGCFITLPDYSTWSDEFPGTESENIMTKFTSAVSFIMNSSDEEFAAMFEQYFNLEAAINYYLFGLFACHLDGFGKNQLMLTYDSGETWYPSLYDLDSTFGLYWNGSKIVSTEYRMFEDYEIYNSDAKTNGKYNLLYKRLLKCFPKEIYDRYQLLRQNQFSLSYVERLITEFHNSIPTELFEEDLSIWPDQPSKAYDYTQMIDYITNRATYSDAQIELLNNTWNEIQTITVSAESTNLEVGNTIKLNHAISPCNASNKKVIWSVSEDTLARIDQKGNFTALANGTVTVSCTSVENDTIIGTYIITIMDARADNEKITTDGLIASWNFNDINKYKYYNDGVSATQYFSVLPTDGDASKELISPTRGDESRALSKVIPHMVSESTGFNNTINDGSSTQSYNSNDFENTILDASITSDNTYSIELVVKLTQKPITNVLYKVNSCIFKPSTNSLFLFGDRQAWTEPNLLQSEVLSDVNVGDIITFTIVSTADNVKLSINGNIVLEKTTKAKDWSSLTNTSISIPITSTYYSLMNAKLYSKNLNLNELSDNVIYNNAIFNIAQ